MLPRENPFSRNAGGLNEGFRYVPREFAGRQTSVEGDDARGATCAFLGNLSDVHLILRHPTTGCLGSDT